MKKNIRMKNNSTLILKSDILIDEGIELDGYLVLDKHGKNYIFCKNKKWIIYSRIKRRKRWNLWKN